MPGRAEGALAGSFPTWEGEKCGACSAGWLLAGYSHCCSAGLTAADDVRHIREPAHAPWCGLTLSSTGVPAQDVLSTAV
jgi:hypothetical protein